MPTISGSHPFVEALLEVSARNAQAMLDADNHVTPSRKQRYPRSESKGPQAPTPSGHSGSESDVRLRRTGRGHVTTRAPRDHRHSRLRVRSRAVLRVAPFSGRWRRARARHAPGLPRGLSTSLSAIIGITGNRRCDERRHTCCREAALATVSRDTRPRPGESSCRGSRRDHPPGFLFLEWPWLDPRSRTCRRSARVDRCAASADHR
jgi:hypothetical protein